MKKIFIVLEVIDSRIADIHHVYDNLDAAKEKVAENPEHFVIEERSVLSDSSLLQSDLVDKITTYEKKSWRLPARCWPQNSRRKRN